MSDSDARNMTNSTVATTTAAGSTTATTASHNGSSSRPGIVATVRVAARRPVRVVSRSISKPALSPPTSLPQQQQQQCHHSNGNDVRDEDTDVSGDTAAACEEACVLCDDKDSAVAATASSVLATAVSASNVRCFYPASLWCEQHVRGRADADVMTPQTTYTLLPRPRLEVGKYVPDPLNLDYSNPKYTPPPSCAEAAVPTTMMMMSATVTAACVAAATSLPSLQRTRSISKACSNKAEDDDDNGGGDKDSDTTTTSASSPTSTSSLCDGDDGGVVDKPSSSSSWQRHRTSYNDEDDSSNNKKKTMTTYRVVMPRYAASTATLYFPIQRHAHQPRYAHGSSSSDNNNDATIDRAPLQSQLATVCIQRGNVNRMCLYKIGPYAVAFRVVVNALEAAGMRYTASNELFNLLWAKRATPYTLAALTPYQKVNHFPGTWGIGRKDSLALNMNRMRRFFGDAVMDVTPPSFILPQQREELLSEAERHPATAQCPLVYILKPCASSCGRGIQLCKGTPPMPRGGRRVVCQRYIGNPLLIDGRKFDLRLYCVVTSFDPLRVYLFDDGLVRFAAERYTGPDSCLDNVHVHLTNYSVNKTAELRRGMRDSRQRQRSNRNSSCGSRSSTTAAAGGGGGGGGAGGGGSVCSDTEDSVAAALRSGSNTKKRKSSKVGNDKDGSDGDDNDDDGDDDGGDDDNRPVDIKWTLTQLREYLRVHHPRGDDAWRIIEDGCSDVVIKALLSIESDVVERVRSECSDKSGRNCFELFGLDVMVDDALRVRLLEVNIMPSLATGTPLDKAVKSRMLAHLLTLVRVVPHRRDAVPSSTITAAAAAAAASGGGGVRSNGVCSNNNSNSNSGAAAAAGASRLVYNTAAMPRGPEATHPERVYAFGRHPNGGALLHDQPLLARFNDISNAHSLLSPAEVLMLVEADEELRCAGGFRRIFPHSATVMRYLPYFTNGVRRNTYLLVSAVMMQAKKCN